MQTRGWPPGPRGTRDPHRTTVQRKGFDTRVMAETTAHGAITQAPHSHRWGLNDLASGATASSEGAQPVCRLPLAAFRLSTSDFSSRRPAAVIQYDDQGSGAPPPSKPFIGASDDHERRFDTGFVLPQAHFVWGQGDHQHVGRTALLSGGHTPPT